MPAKALHTFEARDCAHWRDWLAGHHATDSEVWLVFYKRHTGKPILAYEDAVEEALCYGWIDSLVRRLDDERYARKFTPRKADSRWSTANRKRFAKLAREGRLMPAGLARPPTARDGDAPRPSTTNIPAYISEALAREPKAAAFFASLAPSYRRMYLAWIDSARQEETRARRLREAIGKLAAGEKLGLK